MQKLNRIERLKEESPPSDFEKRLERLDWEQLTKEDRFYLSNYGIYASSLRPDRCMIRIRFDGGNPTPPMLQTVAECARDEGVQILMTARCQMELHGIAPRRLYPLWQRLHAAGLSTFQTLSDNFRALVTDPLSDCVPDAQIDTFPLIEAIRQRFLRRPEWIGTIPRKFNTALVGRHTPSFNPWHNDLLFALARKNGRWGFNIYLGGRFNATARDADIFCLPEEAPDLFEAIARTYRKHGYRGSRSKTRIFHLIDTVGTAQMRTWIEREMGRSLPEAGELQTQSASLNRDERLPIKRYGHFGEIDPDTLQQAAEKAQREGLTLRLTPRQELWAFDPGAVATHHLHTETSSDSSPGAPSLTACAGSRYCALSLWDVKKDLALLPLERFRKLGVNLGFSGCLKGCGRHYHSDLGIIGLRTNLYGPTERAARIFLGALQAPDPAPGRMLYYSVPLRHLNALLLTILEDFEESGLESFERFSREVLAVYPIEFLQVWYLIRQLHPLEPRTIRYFLRHDHSALLEAVEAVEAGSFLGDLHENVRRLSHRLWDRPSQKTDNPL